MAASQRFRFDMRAACYGAAAFALLAVILLVVIAINERRVAAALRDRGVLVQGQRTGTSCSSSHDKHGFSTETCVGIWAYVVGGERLTLYDRGVATVAAVENGPGWGAPRDGQIVYLPERPGTARMRAEIAPDMVPYLGGAGFFLILAIVFGLAGWKLLDPARQLARPRQLSRDERQRLERRGLWISRAMLIGIPIAVIAGFFLI